LKLVCRIKFSKAKILNIEVEKEARSAIHELNAQP